MASLLFTICSRFKIREKNVMDKIWDRKSFEIGSHWLLCCGGDEKKTNDHAEPYRIVHYIRHEQ